MGIFSIFGGKNKTVEQDLPTIPAVPERPVSRSETPTSTAHPVSCGVTLNLEKGIILDLNKVTDSLDKIRVAMGWDVPARGRAYDLDECAILMSGGRVYDLIYFATKHGNNKLDAIYLDGDNLTGAGDGDDENIHVVLSKLPKEVDRIIFGAVIYEAKNRNQCFRNVKNAYIRVIDENNGGERELCRYSMTEDGGDNTALNVAELIRDGDHWSFRANGIYSKDTIRSLRNRQVNI